MADCEGKFSEENLTCSQPDWITFAANLNEQCDEVDALRSFFETTDTIDVLEKADAHELTTYKLQVRIQVETPEKPIVAELWLPSEAKRIAEVVNDVSVTDAQAETQITNAAREIENSSVTPKTVRSNDSVTACRREAKEAFASGDEPTVVRIDRNTVPALQRSLSGRRDHTKIRCTRLPPLLLTVKLPDRYPSECGPQYSLAAAWLSREQLESLCERLDEIWTDNCNMPVLYTWLEWLQTGLVQHLQLFEEPRQIILTPLNVSSASDREAAASAADRQTNQNAERAVCTFSSADSLIYEFLRHDYVEDIKAFRRSMQTCPICFEEKLGVDFYRLHDCKHSFCSDCLRAMCQMHVKEGTVQLLKCPDNDCDHFVPFDIMSAVLTDDEFERWEQLLFQRSLDAMSDVIYCPKCSNPVVIEKNDTHAFCMICNADYCQLCKDTWHAGACLSAEQKLNDRVQQMQLTPDELLKLTDEQLRTRFRASDYEFAVKLQKKVVEIATESLANDFIHKYVKCPKCSAPIDKFEGCNKVVCICGCALCYVCGKMISGYEHFSDEGSRCQLWNITRNVVNRMPPHEPHPAQLAVQRVLQLVPDQRRFTMSCPSCGQMCLRLERNNHIKCWLCSSNMCFCCKKRIVTKISEHFRASAVCKQHSD